MQNMLSHKLKEARKCAGFSQSEVADVLHITRQAISNWEQDKAHPSIEELTALCNLYQVSLDELLETSYAAEKNSHMNAEFSKQSMIFEMVAMAVILLFSCQYAFLGTIVAIAVFILMKIKKRNYKFVYFLCVICLLINLFNTVSVFTYYYDFGSSVIERQK